MSWDQINVEAGRNVQQRQHGTYARELLGQLGKAMCESRFNQRIQQIAQLSAIHLDGDIQSLAAVGVGWPARAGLTRWFLFSQEGRRPAGRSRRKCVNTYSARGQFLTKIAFFYLTAFDQCFRSGP